MISVKIKLLFVVTLVFCISDSFSQTNQTAAPGNESKTITVQNFRSPSAWIQINMDRLSRIETSTLAETDTAFFNKKLEIFERGLETISSSIPELENTPNLRRFFNTKNRLNKIKEEVENENKNVKVYTNELYSFLDQIYHIQKDSVLENIIRDSSIIKTYAEEFGMLNNRVTEVDTLCKQKLRMYVGIEKKFSEMTLNTLKLRNRLTTDINNIRNNVLKAEEPPVWSMGKKKYPGFIDVLLNTAKIKFKVLLDYSKSSLFELILMRILILLFALLPVLYMKRIYKQGPETVYTRNFEYIHKYTAYLAAPTILVFAPLLFHFPPLIFLDLLLISLVIAVSLITLKDIKTLNKNFIVMLLVYYVILKLVNIFIQVTLAERILYTLSILIVPGAISFFRRIPLHNIRQKTLIRIVVIICALHVFAGWVFCCLGNFILGKWLIIGGLDGFFFIIILFFSIKGIGDYILMAGDTIHRKNPGFRPNLVSFLGKLRPYLVFVAASVWFVEYLMNLNLLESVKKSLGYFFSRTRFIGDLGFTLNDVAIFFGFSIGGVLISGLLKTLLKKEHDELYEKQSNWEDYIFILRLVIITTGILLGITAAGIDMNNLTVLLGALGVGLGFGLQHIFNNLVSGVLIAFEKPFKIGDLLTLPEGSGRVKEMGLRSTILVSGEGAEIIVPNGNLISNAFSNWTLTNSRKKVTITVQVARDADPGNVKDILEKAVEKKEYILLNPPPLVSIKNITGKYLLFEIDFWVENVKYAESVRSKINEEIAEVFLLQRIGTPLAVQLDASNDKK